MNFTCPSCSCVCSRAPPTCVWGVFCFHTKLDRSVKRMFLVSAGWNTLQTLQLQLVSP